MSHDDHDRHDRRDRMITGAASHDTTGIGVVFTLLVLAFELVREGVRLLARLARRAARR